ncbi:hypothetical protein C3L29_031150, partial [Pseudomonas sp. MWU12-2534b]
MIFWSPKSGAVYFLAVQQGASTFIGNDISIVFNSFLVIDGIRDRVLHEKLIASLGGRLGKIKASECYIAEPWQMLGGSGDESTYTKGDLVVYHHLVAQAIK